MRRSLAEFAEVIDGTNETAADQLLPDAINHDTSRQRIVGRGDPVRQFASSALRSVSPDRCLLIAGQHSRKPPRNDGAFALELSAQINRSIGDPGPLAAGHAPFRNRNDL